jgi:hypothetical protein
MDSIGNLAVFTLAVIFWQVFALHIVSASED